MIRALYRKYLALREKERLLQECMGHLQDVPRPTQVLPNPKTIAFDMIPRYAAWGGGNQFLCQFIEYVVRKGHRVTFDLKENPDVVILVAGKMTGTSSATISIRDVCSYTRRKPETIVATRINDSDCHRGSSDINNKFVEMAKVANIRIFISDWLRSYYALDLPDQHVIHNGCDDSVFFPGDAWEGKEVFKIVTHHWSANWNKGFDQYSKIDRAISDGVLKNVSLTIVGRWPEDAEWRAADLIQPLSGIGLGDVLRGHHAYVTASRGEACGMHHVEAARCGLPVLFHRDGGGIVEMCRRYGVMFDEDPVAAVNELIVNYSKLRDSVISYSDSLTTEHMCKEYCRVIGF